jgi:hypothetical protein
VIDKLLHYIGQGIYASPIIWAWLNQLMVAALGENFDCMQLVDIDRKKHAKPEIHSWTTPQMGQRTTMCRVNRPM